MGDTEKLALCLDKLGGLRLDTLVERKIVQKKTYFLQQFGLDLGYSFGFYVYGPYSPELTEDAYFLKRLMERAPTAIEEPKLSEEELKALDRTKELIAKWKVDDAEKTAYNLELLSSMHFLWKFSYGGRKTKEGVFKKLWRRKYVKDERDLEESWKTMAAFGLIEK